MERIRRPVSLLALALVTALFVLGCAADEPTPTPPPDTPVPEPTATPIPDDERENSHADGARKAPVSLRVEPAMAIFPETDTGTGLWFLVSGLEPGQQVSLATPDGPHVVGIGRLDIEFERGVTVPDVAIADERGTAMFSTQIRNRQRAFLWDERNTIWLVDAVTNEILASAPVFFCFPGEDVLKKLWCADAKPLLPRVDAIDPTEG